MPHPTYLRLATKIATANNDYPKWKHGAVVTKGGAVQAVGWNKLRNSPLVFDQNDSENPPIGCSIHAEQDVYSRVANPYKSTLFLARVSNKNVLNSKPCKSCRKLLHSLEIKKVIYTIDNESYGVWS